MRYKHIEGVKVTAQFSDEDGLRYRYRLEIVLEEGPRRGKTACVVMQNPSYAGEEVADKSVQFMEKVVFQKGLPHEIGRHNDAAIETALNDSDIIIIGRG